MRAFRRRNEICESSFSEILAAEVPGIKSNDRLSMEDRLVESHWTWVQFPPAPRFYHGSEINMERFIDRGAELIPAGHETRGFKVLGFFVEKECAVESGITLGDRCFSS